MITSWDIYWITRLDGVLTLLEVVGFLAFGILMFAVAFGPIIFDDLDIGEFFNVFKKHLIALFCFGILCVMAAVFIPSTKEFAAIYLIPKIANNEQVQKIPDNAAKLLNAKLEEWLQSAAVKKDSK